MKQKHTYDDTKLKRFFSKKTASARLVAKVLDWA